MGRLLKESDPGARLVRGAEGVLRHALEARDLGTDADDSVHRSLRALCRLARTHGIHVEQLVVLCKDAWRSLPEARGLSPETGTSLLKSIISRCIDEYYRTDREEVARPGLSDAARGPESSLSFMLGPLS